MAIAHLLAIKAAHKAKTFTPRGKKRRRVDVGSDDGGGGGASQHEARREYPSWRAYPELVTLERDPADPAFVRSFQPSDAAALDFFREHGFVVFACLSEAECELTRSEIWGQLEDSTAGFKRDDRTTWGLLSSKTYGLAPVPVGGSISVCAKWNLNG
jgi:hypothetical protein